MRVAAGLQRDCSVTRSNCLGDSLYLSFVGFEFGGQRLRRLRRVEGQRLHRRTFICDAPNVCWTKHETIRDLSASTLGCHTAEEASAPRRRLSVVRGIFQPFFDFSISLSVPLLLPIGQNSLLSSTPRQKSNEHCVRLQYADPVEGEDRIGAGSHGKFCTFRNKCRFGLGPAAPEIKAIACEVQRPVAEGKVRARYREDHGTPLRYFGHGRTPTLLKAAALTSED